MGFGFKHKPLQDEKLPYKVVEKEVTLTDGTTTVLPVKVYQKLQNCGLRQVVYPSQPEAWAQGLDGGGV